MHASCVLVTGESGDTIWKGASSVLPMALSPDDNDDERHEYHDGRAAESHESVGKGVDRPARERLLGARREMAPLTRFSRPTWNITSKDGARATIVRRSDEWQLCRRLD